MMYFQRFDRFDTVQSPREDLADREDRLAREEFLGLVSRGFLRPSAGPVSLKIGSSGGSTVVVRRGPQPTKTGANMLTTHIIKGLRFTKYLPQSP